MKQKKQTILGSIGNLFFRGAVVTGAVGLTLVFFLILPWMQTLAKPPESDLSLQTVETAKLDAPDPPPEPEPEKEPEPEEEPPKLMEEAAPLDLAQLELALNPGFSEGWMGGDFTVKLNTVVSKSKDVDDLFSIADLDQQPRVIYQTSPVLTKEVKKKAPGKVYVVFIVDREGRVENPIVQQSTDPVFDKPAQNAVKRWKFEPGKKNGKPVRFRMRVPITFPQG